jgi:hypothetical protein
MTIIEEIKQNIEELKSLVYSDDITAKSQSAEMLATRCCNLAFMAADAYEKSSNAEYLFKSAVDQEVAYGTGAVANKTAKAKADNKVLHQDWITNDALYKRCSLLLAASNTLIEQTRQSVSNLKREMGNGFQGR